MKISEVVNRLLETHNSPHIEHYHDGLELQIEPVDDETRQETGIVCNTFKYRIPKHGSTEPIDNDRDMMYPQELLQQVGTSGWNWRDKRSEFVIFDFDSQHGHAAGLAEEDLRIVCDAAMSLPYVQVHRSKSGRGLHFYVELDGIVEAPTRKEHRLASRAVILQMSKDAGLDFSDKSDCEGVIGWIWHRNAAPNGFELLKPATEKLQLADNWNAIAVAAERRRRQGQLGHVAASILEDIKAGNDVELDIHHKDLIEWLSANGYACTLEGMEAGCLLRTHTAGLKAAHGVLQFKGVFETDSQGTDITTPNCFCFPRPNGSWIVRRYGPGCREAQTWRQDHNNWTYCFYNDVPDFATVVAAAGATDCGRGVYRLNDHRAAAAAMELIGVELSIPERLQGRPVEIKKTGVGVLVSMSRNDGDRQEDGPTWRLYRGNWERQLQVDLREADLPSLDHYIRRLKSRANVGLGFVQRSDDGEWIDEDGANCRLRLLSLGLSESEAKSALGTAIGKPWTLVNDPFGPEYSTDRRWNRDGAQLAFEPAAQDGPVSHWDNVFDHCGKDLDKAVEKNGWCREHGLKTGADYLRLWAAILFQNPKQRLPYLFFFSENRELGTEVQNAGKSTFHEALGMLMTKGYQKADTALTNQQGFNGELESAILCVVEETDVSQKGTIAYNRIKEWVTAPQFNIHRKGATPYMSEFNATHWVQCANRRKNCPVFDQDTRIVVIEVQQLENPDADFKNKLRGEAPFFLYQLLSMDLPPAEGRLYLPLLETDAKRDAMAANRDEKLLRVIQSVMTLGRNLKIWDKPAGEIAKAYEEEFPEQKAPNPTSIGIAIRDFKKAFEDSDFVVRSRPKNGKTYYVIAPRRTVEQVDSEKWSFVYADNGEIESICIDPNDPEAQLEEWSPDDDALYQRELAIHLAMTSGILGIAQVGLQK